MAISTNNHLSAAQSSQFFLAPEATRQRQYEALRAYFVDDATAAEVAERFGYATSSFRSLCHRFRADASLRAGFFQVPQPRPQYRLLAKQVGNLYRNAEAKTIFQQLLDVAATVVVEDTRVVATIHKRSHNPYLVSSRLADEATPMPWFGNKLLVIRFA